MGGRADPHMSDVYYGPGSKQAEPTSLDLLRCAGAIFSEDGRYRYALYRDWMASWPPALFIMQNGSKAGLFGKDDLTVQKCRGFANLWRCGSIYVGNLWGFVSTDPDGVASAERAGVDAIGPENLAWLTAMVVEVRERQGVICVAWGDGGRYADRDVEVMRWLGEKMRVVPYCLGRTALGSPRHPSRLADRTGREAYCLTDRRS